MPARADRHRASAGFTLLELLVVIGLFALVAAMAYGGLMSVLKTRTGIEKNLDRTAAYQKAWWILRNDFQNGVDRPVRGNRGTLKYAFSYIPLDREVDFTRGGWANPLRLPRSTLRRLGYFWDSDKKALMRRTWPVLDRAPQTKPVDTELLSGVDEIEWRFLDANGEWHERWPPPQLGSTDTGGIANTGLPGTNNAIARSPPPPQAVKLTLDTRDWGKLTFLFSYGLPATLGGTQAAAAAAAAAAAQGNVFNPSSTNTNTPARGPSGLPRQFGSQP